jgi:hypothetical protein
MTKARDRLDQKNRHKNQGHLSMHDASFLGHYCTRDSASQAKASASVLSFGAHAHDKHRHF